MKNLFLTLMFTLLAYAASAQQTDAGKMVEYPKGKGYYYESILKDVNAVDQAMHKEEPYKRFVMDQSTFDLPNDVSLYKRYWAFEPESQGNAGSCWCFSTISMYESEYFRTSGKKVELSEIYVVYWEYVEKARRFISERGNSHFEQGSEGNAVARIASLYGLLPKTGYTGLINGRKFHTHDAMFNEMSTYLNGLKKTASWNEKEALETIRAIMNHHIGEPPSKVILDGKSYSPMSYMKDYLKLNPEDFVEILSYKQEPYWQQVEYKVPDNWWHNADYYNIPLDDYMKVLKKAIRKGYTISIGGDTSESGFLRETQCAMIPSYDIPAEFIDEDARQFRFSNETTTDDHGIHMVGYLENYNGDGKDWYLIKDSGSGSRNNDQKAPEFGYYFFHEDYVKLKMMGFTIHKDAVKELLKKFN